MSNVTFRLACNADRGRLAEIVASVLAEYGLRFAPDSTDADLADIDAHYMQRGGIFEIAEDESGQVLGMYGIYPLEHGRCELRKMYFLPAARGLGLGKQALDRAVEHARKLGFDTMVLETSSVLKEAIRLYTRCGFIPFQSDHLASRCDQAYILDLRHPQNDLRPSDA
jgi:putative acetyltransferase